MRQAPLFYNFISFGGLICLLALARLSSLGKGKIRWSAVAWGLGLQFALAFVFFALPAGGKVMLWINGVFLAVLDSAHAGTEFLFGPLAQPPGADGSIGFILAFQGLATVVFFMALMALLYQAGIIQRLVKLFARLFVRTLGTSGAESLGVAGNIFVGAESAGVVRPFLPDMTHSELFQLLTASMATVAGTVLGLYVATLHMYFPNIAGHLISASIISAPAAIVVAKLMEPEMDEPLTAGRTVDPHIGQYDGIMEAISAGSMDGVKLGVGICAMLLGFLGLAALLEKIIGGGFSLVGLDGFGLKQLLAYAAWPFTVAMGVPLEDAPLVAKLVGERVIVTEIPGYVQLAQMLEAGQLTYSRSPLIATYALCGFAHVGSMAIYIGGFGALAPGRLGELSRMGLKALWAATLTTLMTGCVAGMFALGGPGILGLNQ